MPPAQEVAQTWKRAAIRAKPGALRLWRVSKSRECWEPGSGPGRWSRAEDSMIYASTTAALAALEALAHLERSDADKRHRLAWAEIATGRTDVICLDAEHLSPRWKQRRAFTQALGRHWLESQASVVLLVPSALVGGEMNALVNPAHPRWAQWREHCCDAAFRFDPRLTRARR